MAMSGKALGDSIAEIVTASDAPEAMKEQIKAMWESIGTAIVSHIVENIEIKIPSGSVIVSVSGGSGAPAVGTTNSSPIDATVDA